MVNSVTCMEIDRSCYVTAVITRQRDKIKAVAEFILTKAAAAADSKYVERNEFHVRHLRKDSHNTKTTYPPLHSRTINTMSDNSLVSVNIFTSLNGITLYET